MRTTLGILVLLVAFLSGYASHSLSQPEPDLFCPECPKVEISQQSQSNNTLPPSYLDLVVQPNLSPHLVIPAAIESLNSDGEYNEFNQVRVVLAWSAMHHLYGFNALWDNGEIRLAPYDFVRARCILTRLQVAERYPGLIAKHNALSDACMTFVSTLEGIGENNDMLLPRLQANLATQLAFLLAKIPHYQAAHGNKQGGEGLDLRTVEEWLSHPSRATLSERSRNAVLKAAQGLGVELEHWHPDCARAILGVISQNLGL